MIPRTARADVGGFTLLEALAAVITLGLLAAAVVPLQRQLGQTALAERVQAQGYLRAMPTQGDWAVGSQSIDIHPGWNLVVSELVAEPEPEPPAGCLPPAGQAHRWLLVGIHAAGSDETLAETMVAVLAPGFRP